LNSYFLAVTSITWRSSPAEGIAARAGAEEAGVEASRAEGALAGRATLLAAKMRVKMRTTGAKSAMSASRAEKRMKILPGYAILVHFINRQLIRLVGLAGRGCHEVVTFAGAGSKNGWQISFSVFHVVPQGSLNVHSFCTRGESFPVAVESKFMESVSSENVGVPERAE